MRSLVIATFILTDESNSFRVVAETQNDLVECLWDDNLVCSNHQMFLIIEQRTADDINISIFFRPPATSYLDFVPVTTVQASILWTDI